MEKLCAVCGQQFKTYPSKLAIGRGKFCSRTCSFTVTNTTLANNGKAHRFQKGKRHAHHSGRTMTVSGYIEIFSPTHPHRTKRGYVREHRLVVEKHLGRYLSRDEDVHHKNGNKQDNRIENLEVMSHIEHIRHHGPLVEKRWAKHRKVVVSPL